MRAPEHIPSPAIMKVVSTLFRFFSSAGCSHNVTLHAAAVYLSRALPFLATQMPCLQRALRAQSIRSKRDCILSLRRLEAADLVWWQRDKWLEVYEEKELCDLPLLEK